MLGILVCNWRGLLLLEFKVSALALLLSRGTHLINEAYTRQVTFACRRFIRRHMSSRWRSARPVHCQEALRLQIMLQGFFPKACLLHVDVEGLLPAWHRDQRCASLHAR